MLLAGKSDTIPSLPNSLWWEVGSVEMGGKWSSFWFHKKRVLFKNLLEPRVPPALLFRALAVVWEWGATREAGRNFNKMYRYLPQDVCLFVIIPLKRSFPVLFGGRERE